jgi:hypothetical protein
MFPFPGRSEWFGTSDCPTRPSEFAGKWMDCADASLPEWIGAPHAEGAITGFRSGS